MKIEMKGVDWTPVPHDTECQNRDGSVLRATHWGIWNFFGGTFRVYRLEDGRTVIDAEDTEKFFTAMGFHP